MSVSFLEFADFYKSLQVCNIIMLLVLFNTAVFDIALVSKIRSAHVTTRPNISMTLS